MKPHTTTELIQSTSDKDPTAIRKFSALDKSCKSMIIHGTRIFKGIPDIENMRKGLQELLIYYPHLTGRIQNKEKVVLSNQGIVFSVGEELQLDISDISKIQNPRKYFASNISAKDILQGKQAPLCTKITKLKNGYVLSIQCSHACMDGNSFYSMADNRGKICRQETFSSPILDQTLVVNSKQNPKEETTTFALLHGWKKLGIRSLFVLIRATITGRTKAKAGPLYLSEEEINSIRGSIVQKTKKEISTHVALSAHLINMFRKLMRYAEKETCSQVNVVDVRERMINIPKTFVGNASITITTPEFPASTTEEQIAEIIHDTLAPNITKPSQELTEAFKTNIDVIGQKLPMVPFNVLGMFLKKPNTFYINNFSKLPIYGPDFGQGKPISVIPHDLGDQIIIRPAAPSKGGLEIYFSGALAKRAKELI